MKKKVYFTEQSFTMHQNFKFIFKESFEKFILISLLNDKILGWSKLKAFADDKINANKKLKYGLGREENIV